LVHQTITKNPQKIKKIIKSVYVSRYFLYILYVTFLSSLYLPPIPGYPSVLTVRSDEGPTLEKQSSRMGVFTINQETYNKKPVWGSQNNSQQIYNNGIGKNSRN
jgi:hypothetical protein